MAGAAGSPVSGRQSGQLVPRSRSDPRLADCGAVEAAWLPSSPARSATVSLLDSPRLQNFLLRPARSLASLPISSSSGYGTTPGSSAASSRAASEELLVGADTEPGPEVVAASRLSLSSPTQPRPRRSRSLSSSRASLLDPPSQLMDDMYRERFPQALSQMEQKLVKFLQSEAEAGVEMETEPHNGLISFGRRQLQEAARDCLGRAREGSFTLNYVYELVASLERLLADTQDKSGPAAGSLAGPARRLLLAVARPARLLECLQFEPAHFYQLLAAAEDQAREVEGVTDNLPQYILGKLWVDRDKELPQHSSTPRR